MIIAPIVHFNPRAPCGARPSHRQILPNPGDFNPRAPCGARRDSGHRGVEHIDISIHAPLAGRDSPPTPPRGTRTHFNPRAPCGARRQRPHHAKCGHDFNPRAPCGARPVGQNLLRYDAEFQSTRPLRGATVSVAVRHLFISGISIHAPLAGRDSPNTPDKIHARNFNPRAPCGARHPSRPRPPIACRYFNPRAPCGARRQRAGYEL